ncbi:MAG: DUF6273 domain-containing protein [Lachnospiraceae bacterium]|nr:DUF6273 domain-containing protein [Lachnospiraceae bacterium]
MTVMTCQSCGANLPALDQEMYDKLEAAARRLRETEDYELARGLGDVIKTLFPPDPVEASASQDADSPEESKARIESIFENVTAEADVMFAAEREDLRALRRQTEADRQALAGLGLFKGREKRELQERIADAEKRFRTEMVRPDEAAYERACTYLKEIYREGTRAGELWEDAAYIRKARLCHGAFLNRQADHGRVLFGHYDVGAGPEVLSWLVLQQTETSLLLLAEKGVAVRKYHFSEEPISWEESDLRAWLNGHFLEEAFDHEERSIIADTKVLAEKNPEFNTETGNDTVDKLFLMSYPEYEYFKDRVGLGAVEVAESLSGNMLHEDQLYWWLRTPGKIRESVVCIDDKGRPIEYGLAASLHSRVVRPMLRIDLTMA